MKRNLLKLMMLLAMVVLAGSAMAQNEPVVTVGGTYTYNLTGISSKTAATATVAFSGASTATAINEVSGYSIAAGATNQTVSFTVLYGTIADPATSGFLTVTITDDAADGCNNYIEYAIQVDNAPTIAFAITGDVDFCQGKHVTPLADNTPATSDVLSNNTIDYPISIVVTDEPTNYDGIANLTITGGDGVLSDYAVTYSGEGDYNVSTGELKFDEATAQAVEGTITGTLTITFTTTVNLDNTPVDVAATGVALTENVGNQTYAESPADILVDNNEEVIVKAMPAIGSFVF